jgi:hypothetical protein
LDKFVEAPTKEDIVEEDREEEMRESGLFETGRSILTGY